jgi:membrane associated rhomboid family serine protease
MIQLHAVANLAVIAVTLLVTLRGFRDPGFRERMIMDTQAVLRRGEIHRVLTSAFLHADWGHFGFNMFSLFAFGSAIELAAGARIFLLIYLTSIVGGDLLSLALHRHENYRALGASGGVSGVVFAAIFLFPGGGVLIFPLMFPIPAWIYAIFFVLTSIYGIRTRAGNIGHDAHLGGALVGLLVTAVLFPQVILHSLWLFLLIFGITAAFFLYLARYGPGRLLRIPGLGGRPPHPPRPPKVVDFPRDRRPNHQAVIDILLDKVAERGIEGLTPAERELLERLSKEHGE